MDGKYKYERTYTLKHFKFNKAEENTEGKSNQ